MKRARDEQLVNQHYQLCRKLVQLQRQALVANAATQLVLYRQMQAIRQRLQSG